MFRPQNEDKNVSPRALVIPDKLKSSEEIKSSTYESDFPPLAVAEEEKLAQLAKERIKLQDWLDKLPTEIKTHPIYLAAFICGKGEYTKNAMVAGATHFKLSIEKKDENLVITIEDNGSGFSEDLLKNPNAEGFTDYLKDGINGDRKRFGSPTAGIALASVSRHINESGGELLIRNKSTDKATGKAGAVIMITCPIITPVLEDEVPFKLTLRPRTPG